MTHPITCLARTSTDSCLDRPMRVAPARSQLQLTQQQHSRCKRCSPLVVCASTQQQHHQTTNCEAVATGRRPALLATAVLLQQLVNQPRDCSAAQSQQHHQQPLPIATHASRRLAMADIQADYDRYAASYDSLDGGAASEALGFPELRQQLLQQARGDVLEVGVGTGLNLPFYNWSNVTTLTGADISAGMLTAAAARIQSVPSLQQANLASLQINNPNDNSLDIISSSSSSSGVRDSAGVPVWLVQADVTELPFPDCSFDAVVDTFSLCVFARPQEALAEMARVLRPGGRLLLVEHSRSDNPVLGAYMGATRSIVAPLSKGCDWGQDVPAMLQQLPGLTISSQQRHLAGTLVSIVATKQG